MRRLKHVLKAHEVALRRHEEAEAAVFQRAVTKEKRQEMLTVFFKRIFAEVTTKLHGGFFLWSHRSQSIAVLHTTLHHAEKDKAPPTMYGAFLSGVQCARARTKRELGLVTVLCRHR